MLTEAIFTRGPASRDASASGHFMQVRVPAFFFRAIPVNASETVIIVLVFKSEAVVRARAARCPHHLLLNLSLIVVSN